MKFEEKWAKIQELQRQRHKLALQRDPLFQTFVDLTSSDEHQKIQDELEAAYARCSEGRDRSPEALAALDAAREAAHQHDQKVMGALHASDPLDDQIAKIDSEIDAILASGVQDD